MGLTKMDVEELRSAYTMAFIYQDGKGYIEMTREEDLDHPYRIATETRFVNEADQDGKLVRAAAFFMLARQNRRCATIARLLQEGDRIELEWQRDRFTTANMEAEGFHTDALFLNIIRDGQVFTFLVDVYTTNKEEMRMVESA
ncbi:hypothetical protein ACP3TJ_00100 [Desulforudis sp. 1088]|uniref:hypothetical protein n=1 Tax=unclassified Candidatus Desulforudis TaxID=2635950 RepID=UPI003CE4F672